MSPIGTTGYCGTLRPLTQSLRQPYQPIPQFPESTLQKRPGLTASFTQCERSPLTSLPEGNDSAFHPVDLQVSATDLKYL
eukprot:2292932-Amphidinium_carterae.1